MYILSLKDEKWHPQIHILDMNSEYVLNYYVEKNNNSSDLYFTIPFCSLSKTAVAFLLVSEEDKYVRILSAMGWGESNKLFVSYHNICIL